MATNTRYQNNDLRRQVGSPKPKGRGTSRDHTSRARSRPLTLCAQRTRKHYVATFLSMATVGSPTRAAPLTTTPTKGGGINPICRCQTLLSPYSALRHLDRLEHGSTNWGLGRRGWLRRCKCKVQASQKTMSKLCLPVIKTKFWQHILPAELHLESLASCWILCSPLMSPKLPLLLFAH